MSDTTETDHLENISLSVTDTEDAHADSIWKKEHTELLTKWKAKLFVQMWLQEKSMYFYQDLNNLITYPVIIISSISSATLFSTNNVAVKYVIGALTLTTGILTAVSRQMRPAELYQQHAIATLRYQALIRTITTYLSLPPYMRASDPKSFMNKVEMDISSLMENQVNPPPYIVKQFEKKYGTIDKLIYGEEILELLRSDHELELTKAKRRIPRKTISQYFFSSSR